MRLIALVAATILSAHGVRLTVPAGWQQVHPASPGPVTDPRTLLVAGTRGARPRPSRCLVGSYRVPPDGAVVVVVGWTSLRDAGGLQRPGRWPLKALVFRRPDLECFPGRAAGVDLMLRGREFQVSVMVGDHASAHRMAEALAVARSFALVP
ncbi:MAG: hypothetical protein ACRDL2_13675 [Gaiellaceae bacterium]